MTGRLRGTLADGFTLIESLVALVVVGVAVAGLLRLQIIGAQTASHASRLWGASLLAQEKMAEALASERMDDGARQGSTGEDPVYAWKVVIDSARDPALAAVGAASRKSVLVTVSWPDGRSERSLSLVTYVSPKR